ncbi:hypothetical protein Misp02_70560 [Microtetraspora sp. NBRC 16547]|nr:hypothetical protein Misp02_70560 [Microtetraspora sp. NBRC 16547]
MSLDGAVPGYGGRAVIALSQGPIPMTFAQLLPHGLALPVSTAKCVSPLVARLKWLWHPGKLALPIARLGTDQPIKTSRYPVGSVSLRAELRPGFIVVIANQAGPIEAQA